MLRVKEGDRAAFELLVEKYKQPVINMVTRLISDQTEAEDLAQNIFVQVYKSADRYRASAKFSTWLYTITRNLCFNELRRRSRHRAESIEEQHPDREDQPWRQFEETRLDEPGEAILQGELFEKVEEAIQELPENQKVALLMCRGEDFSYDEIAAALGCSVPATKSLIHRAREVLKARLKPYLKSGSWRSNGPAKRATFGG